MGEPITHPEKKKSAIFAGEKQHTSVLDCG